MTTDGSNTNPTAVALATIVHNTERLRMFAAARAAEPSAPKEHWAREERWAREDIMEAVGVIAGRNGNTWDEIIDLSNAMPIR